MIEAINSFFVGVCNEKVFIFFLADFPFWFSLFHFAQKNLRPRPPDDDVVKISTNLIQIDVTVTDKNGKIVTDLKPEDFEIYENGKKQNITNFLFVIPLRKPKSIEAVKKTERCKEDKSAIPIPPIQLKPEQVKRTVALIVDDLGLFV